MATISCCACSIDTPGFSLATTLIERPRGVRAVAGRATGAQMSMSRSRNSKPAGITPMISIGMPLTVTLRPRIDSSPPKRRCHRPWLMSILSRGGASSSGVNVRPRSGVAPRMRKNDSLTTCIRTSSGLPPSEMFAVVRMNAAMSVNDCCRSRQ